MVGAIRNISFYNPTLSASMAKLASMQKINTAADNAAGLAILEKLTSQSAGSDRAARNLSEMKDLVNTAEGGMASINDNIQRIRELTIQAGNGIYTSEEKQMIQQEINHLRKGINDTVKTTQYNGMNLLDGTFNNKFTTVNANGAGTRVSIPGMNTQMLGLDGIDVTKEGGISQFLDAIDSAQTKVVMNRSELGAKFNRFTHNVNNLNNVSYNLNASAWRIGGMDYSDISNAINNINRSNITNSYKAFMFQQQIAVAGNFLSYMM